MERTANLVLPDPPMIYDIFFMTFCTPPPKKKKCRKNYTNPLLYNMIYTLDVVRTFSHQYKVIIGRFMCDYSTENDSFLENPNTCSGSRKRSYMNSEPN